jgi:hypothetical protein
MTNVQPRFAWGQRLANNLVWVILTGVATFVGAIVFLFNKRRGVGDQWHEAYPAGQLWVLVGVVLVLMGVATTALRWGRRKEAAEERLTSRLEEIERALAQTKRNLYELQSTPDPVDVRLFKRFITLLPSNGATMQFLSRHSFGEAYYGSVLNPAREYVYEWTIAERQFHDPMVEAAHIALREALQRLIGHLAHTGFRLDLPEDDLYRIYPDHDLDWETAENAFAHEAVREADNLAAVAWEAHQRLVTVGRERLRV